MKRILIIIMFAVFSNNAFAACTTMYPQSENNLISKVNSASQVRTKCFLLRGLKHDNTIIVAEPAVMGQDSNQSSTVNYQFNIKDISGNRIAGKTVYSDPSALKLSLNGHTDATLYLEPLDGRTNHDFDFNVIHVLEEQEVSIIYVSVRTKRVTPDVDEGSQWGSAGINNLFSVLNSNANTKNLNLNPLATTTQSANFSPLATATQSTESPACSSSNRPPNEPPKSKTSNARFNYNQAVRNNKKFYQYISSEFGSYTVTATLYLRMYVTSKMEGEYDVKSKDSIWLGNAADGNFLYGLNMASFGFTESDTTRFSAAYQAIQDEGQINFASVSAGIVNYITNTGDNLGDKEEVLVGHRYVTQVSPTVSPLDTKMASCVDQKSYEQSGGEPGGGGGSWPESGESTSGGGQLICNQWVNWSGTTADGWYCDGGWTYVP